MFNSHPLASSNSTGFNATFPHVAEPAAAMNASAYPSAGAADPSLGPNVAAHAYANASLDSAFAHGSHAGGWLHPALAALALQASSHASGDIAMPPNAEQAPNVVRPRAANQGILHRYLTGGATIDHVMRSTTSTVKQLPADRAIDCLTALREVGIVPNIYVCNTVLSIHVKQRQFAGAVRLLDCMNTWGLKYDGCTYNIMIAAYANSGCVEHAIGLLRRMTPFNYKASHQTYDAVLGACRAQQRPDLLNEVFDVMRAQGFTPDARVYDSSILAFVEMGRSDSALKLFMDAMARDVPLQRLIHRVMADQCRAPDADTDAGLSVVTRMSARGVRVHAEVYGALLRGCQAQGRLDSAIKLFGHMRGQGIEPSVAHYNVLLSICHEHRQWDLGLDVFNFMRSRGVLADATTVDLMHKLAADSDLALTGQVARMRDDGTYPLQ